ncbi:MAG: response regulator [Chloroflexi bacterium]|nr:response regulator [Chloroflexota bacterium]
MTNNVTILNIEDTFENRILIRRILQAEGYTMLEAENASDALEILKTATPDLILMDINMPDMDGYMLTAQLKAIPKLRDVPVIAITANVMRGDRERTLAAGCDGYIQKPIDVDALPQQISRYLKR